MKPLTLFLVGMFAMFAVGFGPASCSAMVTDTSAAALASGNATVVLGGCERALEMGYSVCQLEKGQDLPVLRIGFTNPGEWAVSDCHGGFFKSGATDKPGIVEVDLSALQPVAADAGVCWLRIQTVEHYPAPEDPSQQKPVALAGGFIVEYLAPGFMPVPPDNMTAWCYKIQRTTAGRTKVSSCK